jgi:hypothetical protein
VKKGAALGAAIVSAALVLSTRASAAPSGAGAADASEAEAILLLYEDSPPPDCPTEAEFVAQVEKLTSKARFTREQPGRGVRIELSSQGRDVRGRLVTGDGEHTSSRELRGKTCAEVASALAIAVALTIDPEALLGPGEPPPQPAEPDAGALPPKPAATQPAPTRQAPTTRARPPALPSHSVVDRPARVRVAVGAGLALEGAWAPQMLPGGKLVVLAARGERLRVAVGVTRFITREVDDVSFGAWLVDGSLTYNVAVLGVVRPFASLGYELGTVNASGSGLPSAVEAERPWQAGSVGLGIRFETDGFFVQLGGSLLVPLSRQRYLVSDPFGRIRSVYDVPALGLKQETVVGVFL